MTQHPLESYSSLWWDESGPFKILHQITPLRLQWLLETIGCPAGLNILDVGCGGGLLCEPLARLGATMVGIDPVPNAIQAAKDHNPGLPIQYQEGLIETLDTVKIFDIITAFEVIEHVEHPAEFFSVCARLLKPGGWLMGSTLNRTSASYFLGIVAAEQLLGWVPKGTHQIEKFLTPNEIWAYAKSYGLECCQIQGFFYSFLKNRFILSDRQTVNYFFALRNPSP